MTIPTPGIPEMAGPELTDAYLNHLVEVQRHFLRFRKRYDSEKWMERSEVFKLWADLHIAWSRTVGFLAAELGIESRVGGMWRPDWPNVTRNSAEGSGVSPEAIREADEAADRVISGVYEKALAALGDLALDTDNDDLQWIVEDFADEVWAWSVVSSPGDGVRGP